MTVPEGPKTPTEYEVEEDEQINNRNDNNNKIYKKEAKSLYHNKNNTGERTKFELETYKSRLKMRPLSDTESYRKSTKKSG